MRRFRFSTARSGVDLKCLFRDSYTPCRKKNKELYSWWESCGFFRPCVKSEDPSVENFSMVLPPPNVTGVLHMGHALTVTVQDALVRWKRMNGANVLWVPGFDHAGIATQVVVEKQLMKEKGVTRHELGRDAFLEKVWDWQKQYGNRISAQLRELGASVDWEKHVFTMDRSRSEAVTEAFVLLHERGFIFRGHRMVHWCVSLKTAISDIEVDSQEIKGKTEIPVGNDKTIVDFGVIYDIAYPLQFVGRNGLHEVIVSTTRPETIGGDVALAFHPNDDRYNFLFEPNSPKPLHPLTGNALDVISDSILVDPALGTGVVKVTPGHDLRDYECSIRHKLRGITVFDDDGKLNEIARDCGMEGQNRFDSRNQVRSTRHDHPDQERHRCCQHRQLSRRCPRRRRNHRCGHRAR